jgi:Toprim domain
MRSRLSNMLGAWVSRRLSRSWQAAGNVDVAPTPVVVDKIKGDDEQRARDLRSAAIYVRQMRPLAGTPGEAYLRIERKIDTAVISDVMNSTAAIGWHDEVFFRQENHRLDGRRIGAIIAVMTDALTGAPTGAISRTYIHEGQKIGKAKGLAGSGVVLLTPDEDVLGGLHIAEGLETGLDRMAKGARPMWSTGSTSIMAKLAVVAGIEAIAIFADHDQNCAGEKAAREAEARWLAAGREALVVMPDELGDFNDITMRGAL